MAPIGLALVALVVIIRTTTGGTNWSTVISGDGMQCQIDPTNFNKV